MSRAFDLESSRTVEDAVFLRAQAQKCRALARGQVDERTQANLLALAEEYEDQARRMEGGPAAEPPPAPRPE